MIQGILQFALRIAFRCVLHRCGSQDILRQELWLGLWWGAHGSKRLARAVGWGGARRRIGALPNGALAAIQNCHARPHAHAPPTRATGGREAARRGRREDDRRPLLLSNKEEQEPVRTGFGMDTGNDPSAGSPTETLLRLLLPLNNKVWTASRSVASGEPNASPQSGGLTGSFNR